MKFEYDIMTRVKTPYLKIVLRALTIAVVGVFGIDYFSHLFFSNPMETTPYFLAKMFLFAVFAIVFLSFFKLRKDEFTKVLIGGDHGLVDLGSVLQYSSGTF